MKDTKKVRISLEVQGDSEVTEVEADIEPGRLIVMFPMDMTDDEIDKASTELYSLEEKPILTLKGRVWYRRARKLAGVIGLDETRVELEEGKRYELAATGGRYGLNSWRFIIENGQIVDDVPAPLEPEQLSNLEIINRICKALEGMGTTVRAVGLEEGGILRITAVRND